MNLGGYGASYMPSWRGSSQAQYAEKNVQNGLGAEMSNPTINPVAGEAWKSPTLYFNGGSNASTNAPSTNYGGPTADRDLGGLYYNSGGGLLNPNDRDSRSGFYAQRDAWANPINQLWGGQNSPIQDMYNPTIYNPGADPSLRGDAIYSMPLSTNSNNNLEMMGGGKSGQPNEVYGYTAAGYDSTGYKKDLPKNAKELSEKISGLTLQQLMAMSGGGSSLHEKYSNVAQDYANAYANPNYGKYMLGQQGNSNYGGNSLSKTETQDYLQQAYDKSLTRMNNNYLL